MQYKLKVNEEQLLSGLKTTIRTELNSVLHMCTIDIKRDLKSLITGLITASPEYQSILSGLLKTEFGLEDSESPLLQILEVLRNGLVVTTEPVRFDGLSLNASINIGMIKSDFSDLLSLTDIKYSSGGSEINWLEWLLTKGDSIIILNSSIKYNLSSPEKQNSRTGSAVMVPGRGWRVPPQFSGTMESNWITRTFDLDRMQNLVFDIMARAVQRRI